jgi:hypothetical protein
MTVEELIELFHDVLENAEAWPIFMERCKVYGYTSKDLINIGFAIDDDDLIDE